MLSPRLTALWKAIQAGNKVTLRDVDVDLLSEHFDGLDTDEASEYFAYLNSQAEALDKAIAQLPPLLNRP